MDINVYLFIVIALMLLIIMYLLFVLRRVRTQLALIKDALDDIKGGNLNRRILAGENDMTKTICYDINKIAVNSQAQLIRQRQSEQAYKRLMTSLSHDVKTPLKKWAGGIEITISPNICLISLLVIGSISAIVSVLALRKQTY